MIEIAKAVKQWKIFKHVISQTITGQAFFDVNETGIMAKDPSSTSVDFDRMFDTFSRELRLRRQGVDLRTFKFE